MQGGQTHSSRKKPKDISAVCNHNLVLCSKWYCMVRTVPHLVCLVSCGYFSYSLDSNYSRGGKSLKMCVKKASVKMQRKSLSLAKKMNNVKTNWSRTTPVPFL